MRFKLPDMREMSVLRKVSIILALLALLVLILSWFGVIGRIDKTLIVIPLIILAILLKHTDWIIRKFK